MYLDVFGWRIRYKELLYLIKVALVIINICILLLQFLQLFIHQALSFVMPAMKETYCKGIFTIPAGELIFSQKKHL